MTPTIALRLRTVLPLLLAAAALLLAGAGPVSAHAALTGSDPQQGAVVDQAPDRVSLTFSEQVALSDDSVRVLAPDGERVDTGDPANVTGTTYAVPLEKNLADGTYTVSYQVVSADSHPVAGAYTFSVGAPSATTVSVSDQTAGGGAVGFLYGLGRYLSYVGFAVLAGGAAFVLACWQRGAGVRAVQRLVVAGWLTLTAATLALLLLRGAYTRSGTLGDVLDLNLLSDVLQTKTGAALVSRLLLLAAAALFIAVLFGAYARLTDPGDDTDPDDPGDQQHKRDLTFGLAIGGTVVAAGLAASWAMAEHASSGLQPGIAMPVDVVHLLAVAAWLGGLTTLLVALYRAPETPPDATAVRRFSTLAFASVVALVVTGVYQSWRQLGSWSAFTETRYGQLLLVKLALVALLVGVAWISRRWTARLAETPAAAPRKQKVPAGTSGNPKRAAQLARQQAAIEAARQKRLRDADPDRFGLRRSVLAEAGIAVVLLAVTTMLTSTEPGRTEQEAARATAAAQAPADDSGALTLDMAFDTGGTDGKGVVRVELDPARTGANEMHVYVQRPNGRAFDIPEVKVAFTLEAQDIGPLPVVPDHITTGHWSAGGVQLPMAGDWTVAVTVRTSDIDQTTVSKNAQIG
ncbi:copper resistance protein CopC [Streptomyces sp. NPDC000983]|uniref:copper resistance CopC/CopD family protein n=1 Tax=Streptomyces sp. NPDC000983 TaxID=3154373 RepID=UPI0033340FFC